MMTRTIAATLLGVTLLTVTAAPPENLKRFDRSLLRDSIAAKERHEQALFSHPGVRVSGVGVRRSDGKAVIKIYTDDLSSTNIPDEIDGVPVQVEYVGNIRAFRARKDPENGNTLNAPRRAPNEQPTGSPLTYVSQAGSIDRRDRFARPVPIGVSAGHPGVTAGTLGCRVSQGCHTYALSNNHVFANGNDAQIGDPIIQPGSFDGGQAPADTVGTLFDFVPLNYTQSCNWRTCNRIDAALIEVSAADVGNATTSEGYGLPRTETLQPYVGMKVMKYGRTTGLRYGYIDSISATIDVDYGTSANPEFARFIEQIIIKPADDANYTDFSLGGDSGSLIVAADANYPAPACVNDPQPCSFDFPPIADERKPVALLFAGGGGITVGNRIDDVLNTFDVLVDGE